MRLGSATLIATLMALLAAALWFAYSYWTALESIDMPIWLYLAMAGGIGFSLLIGCGLMALMFYSSRSGHDDRVNDLNE
jgi:hypothetical protein